MQKEHRNDRIQGVLFDAQPTVFAGSRLHPKALVLAARHFARRLTRAGSRPAHVKITKQYQLSANPTELLKRFK